MASRTIEALQSYLKPRSLLMLALGFSSGLPFKAKLWMYAVPVVGQQTAILRLMRGESVTATEQAICVLGSALAALAVCAVTARIYRSERLAISA